MATVKTNQAGKRFYTDVAPYGNLSSRRYPLATSATGAALDSDSTAALAVGDVVDLGELPEGFWLEDAMILVTTAMTASVTGSLGFKYEDGVDSTEVPQDAAYFGAGLNLNTAGRVRATGTKLVKLPKPAKLILTIAGANNAKASDIKVIVHGVLAGAR